jgi:serine/threonine protein kinase
LHFPHAKFSKKADVFAAGIIFLELISLSSPSTLFEILWPRVLEVPLPQALKEILSKSLVEELEARTGSFDELLMILRSGDGKIIGELSDEEDLSFDISSMMKIATSGELPVV